MAGEATFKFNNKVDDEEVYGDFEDLETGGRTSTYHF